MKELKVLDSLKQELIKDTVSVLRFNTVKGEAEENAPFGKGNAECLDFVLKLCEKYGFKTQNFDYYAGHADFGEGSETFGILGHLDVVPADEKSWLAPPFEARIIDGSIYARGALDDKSPMIACLYAVRCLHEAGYKFNKKVRLIFGCDEESGMQCMKHYFTKVAPPDFAISPDANFPVINREKGIMPVSLSFGRVDNLIYSIKGGSRVNVVLDNCVAIMSDKVDISKVTEKYAKDDEVKIEVLDDYIQISVKGKSAHGSQPESGKNASWKLFEILRQLFPKDKAIKNFCEKIPDYHGKKWGVNLEDGESGKLTCNVGVVRYDGSDLTVVVDCRHPVTYTNEQVKALFEEKTDFAKISVMRASQPLFVPEESELVQKLLKAYHTATGNPAYAMSIGGGTYSRCIKNCVAFGPEWPGEPEIIHQPNERISIDRLVEITKVYMEAIKLLCIEQ